MKLTDLILLTIIGTSVVLGCGPDRQAAQSPQQPAEVEESEDPPGDSCELISMTFGDIDAQIDECRMLVAQHGINHPDVSSVCRDMVRCERAMQSHDCGPSDEPCEYEDAEDPPGGSVYIEPTRHVQLVGCVCSTYPCDPCTYQATGPHVTQALCLQAARAEYEACYDCCYDCWLVPAGTESTCAHRCKKDWHADKQQCIPLP